MEIDRSKLYKAPIDSVIRLAKYLGIKNPERAKHCDRCMMALIEAVTRKQRSIVPSTQHDKL